MCQRSGPTAAVSDYLQPFGLAAVLDGHASSEKVHAVGKRREAEGSRALVQLCDLSRVTLGPLHHVAALLLLVQSSLDSYGS